MHSPIEENYLKALYHLSLENGEVSVNDLSKHLGIKMPTVNSMMKKFLEKDLVVYESYKPLRLTDLGKLTAVLIVRKHRLTEMYLVEKMGFAWHEVHEIAEQIEHIQSPLFFEKMDELLAFPKFDPHGSPIPTKLGEIPTNNYIKMSDAKANDVIEITGVRASSEEFLKYLTAKNLQLGTTVKVVQKEAFDGNMVLLFTKSKTEIVVSQVVAEKLWVEKTKA